MYCHLSFFVSFSLACIHQYTKYIHTQFFLRLRNGCYIWNLQVKCMCTTAQSEQHPARFIWFAELHYVLNLRHFSFWCGVVSSPSHGFVVTIVFLIIKQMLGINIVGWAGARWGKCGTWLSCVWQQHRTFALKIQTWVSITCLLFELVNP